jgi:hypothetical protein
MSNVQKVNTCSYILIDLFCLLACHIVPCLFHIFSIIFHRKIYFWELHLISGATPYNKMTTSILEECHETFVSCFHAFYPTAFLKWTCLCDLLAEMDKVGTVVSKVINCFIWAKWHFFCIKVIIRKLLKEATGEV